MFAECHIIFAWIMYPLRQGNEGKNGRVVFSPICLQRLYLIVLSMLSIGEKVFLHFYLACFVSICPTQNGSIFVFQVICIYNFVKMLACRVFLRLWVKPNMVVSKIY